MAKLTRITTVRITLTLMVSLFACTTDDATPDVGTGGINDSSSRSGAGGEQGSEVVSGAGGVTESSLGPDANNTGSVTSGDSAVLPSADAADRREASAGPDAGDTGGATGSDSAVVPSVDGGDSESTTVIPSDSSTGDETWTGPYANVVAVSASGTPGSYTFDVSIESSDIDCSQYASWWEVLTEDGSLIFRRILEHSHTDENGTSDPGAPGNTFTRDGGPIDIEADQVVLVRAHMNTGGYHGDAMRGSVAGGFVIAPDIGAEFAAEVEFEDPQPTRCLF